MCDLFCDGARHALQRGACKHRRELLIVGTFTESRESALANPKPNLSGLKPFKPGQTGNPGGKTSETRRLEVENAESAMRIRAMLLAAAEKKMTELGDSEAALEFVEAAMLKLLKDAEDRGLGAPVQDLRSGDGSLTPATHIRLEGVPSSGS